MTRLIVLLLACLTVVLAAPAEAAPPERTLSVYVTFYGAADNDPPGSAAIAYPRVHRQAGGTGSYADPVTFASAYHATYPPGTRVYLPRLRKYLVMEDDCGCQQPRDHLDVWVGGAGRDQRVLACEDRLTRDGNDPVILNAAPGRVVDPRPLYSAGACAA